MDGAEFCMEDISLSLEETGQSKAFTRVIYLIPEAPLSVTEPSVETHCSVGNFLSGVGGIC